MSFRADMYDYADIEKLVGREAKKGGRPSLIMLKSVIGKGACLRCRHLKGTRCPDRSRGHCRGQKNASVSIQPKISRSLPGAYEFFASRRKELAVLESQWNDLFARWSEKYPDRRILWDASFVPGGVSAADLAKTEIPAFKVGDRHRYQNRFQHGAERFREISSLSRRRIC